jgi:3-oxoacyl-[acyl-carrier protein] reductase
VGDGPAGPVAGGGEGIVMTRNSQYLRDNPVLAVEQVARVALGRPGEPADVANVIAFLASAAGAG